VLFVKYFYNFVVKLKTGVFIMPVIFNEKQMKMKKDKLLSLTFLLGLSLIIGCKSSEENKDAESFENANVDDQSAAYSKEGAKLLYTIPTPLEFANLIKKTGLPYNGTLMIIADYASYYTNYF
jgi:hypothetical protein